MVGVLRRFRKKRGRVHGRTRVGELVRRRPRHGRCVPLPRCELPAPRGLSSARVVGVVEMDKKWCSHRVHQAASRGGPGHVVVPVLPQRRRVDRERTRNASGGRGMSRQGNHTPHERRRGRLRHGNAPGDFSRAPRCGAKTRRGTPCQCPAMRNRRRCRLHGGLSTGPKTAAGIERIRRASTTHGRRTQVAKRERQSLRVLMQECRLTLTELAKSD